ncbi:MAG: pyruvate dehydrogenase (acetyl-transferring), homodimeric type [Bacteroidales bacterium]|nr:pyruvate dehydrogenase (acetyl-transferring), homodimeric type [Bacteroidales bacterium]
MNNKEIFDLENNEWIESLNYIIRNESPDRVKEIITLLTEHAERNGIRMPVHLNTQYINTISKKDEFDYPGDREIERKIKSIIRWNAMAMVVRANREEEGIGGHISTYASSATLYEVGFNHFFRGAGENGVGDIIYYQGHATPGIYARSYLEGRFTDQHLQNFRREIRSEEGLSSYPHPRLMPGYWQFPTVSMGLSPIMAIYQARFNRYLQDNGLLKDNDQKIWAFLGDGEMDEPESMGAITMASREQLDNLIFVINCNLQRLDGPVRGNGSIIQELEAAFKGAGWHVIKVILGSNWDSLLEKDKEGYLVKRWGEIVDGERQKYSISEGAYIRKHFFGKYEPLLKMVEECSDEQLEKLNLGGHDPVKVYNAYKAAVEYKGSPSIILAQTIKGYGLGEAGEGRNITHQQKKLNEEELRQFRTRFNIPLPDEKIPEAPFFKPDENSEEMRYLKERRKILGGFIPKRNKQITPFNPPNDELYSEFYQASGKRKVATTMVVVHLMSKLLKDKNVGKLVVPIVPDESRTFGMDSLFRQVGIYSHIGQLYEPVDKENLLYYKETKDGSILEEGITEAGAMSSFIAAGTAYSTHNINAIPIFIFYSMFGFQRIGDLIWAACDARAKGFLIGGTSGRTTLAGEGLQHQDGNSHLFALPYPSIKAYDPAYAYEVAVIVKEGIKKMYIDNEDVIYYITVMNEKYEMPQMPEGVEEKILKGMYRLNQAEETNVYINLLGSGAILNEVLEAATILKENYGLSCNIWSVTSYKALYENARETERWNRMNPDQLKKSFIEESVGDQQQIFIAVSDYVKGLPLTVSKWFPGIFIALGTDGFGKSDSREELREYFEVNAKHIVLAVLQQVPDKNIENREIKPEKKTR